MTPERAMAERKTVGRRMARVLRLGGMALVRACVIAVLLWSVWSSATAVQRWAAPRVSEDMPVQQAQAHIAPLPAPGYWTFAGSRWEFCRSRLRSREVETRLDSIRVEEAPSGQFPPIDSLRLLELARRLGMESRKNDRQTIYALDCHSLKARLVTQAQFMEAGEEIPLAAISAASKADAGCHFPVGGASAVSEARYEQVLAATVALLTDDGSWELIELQPQPSRLHHGMASSHLLPLPELAQRNCGRWSRDGILLLELVSLRATANSLLQSWTKSGWQVRQSQWGATGNFSYLCVRDGSVVYAWARQSDNLTSLLLSKSRDVTFDSSNLLAVTNHD